ncbi:undecaprenyl-diphosphate phosphatase [Gryllotalpicola protaetiae]|uniref:Undecaprenyl-diphosphatase n=1 Tax=Gryllotalpicola protaetiae TaxID=2419771 RepID=A0A387BRX4_9MICO|nr:undecaprenyl-diphosphate phosphatase [Gryllotalpicola protaetiae]AYG04834.1 undecaprenyl-diphosphate phosphatase [Gryllotalpicola protaetiae]
MNLLQAIILGIVEGITEFLPVSSTGHLTIVEKLLGLHVNDKGVTAFTAIIQVGAIIAVIVYFWRDIVRLVGAWFRGLANRNARGQDYRLAWFVIIGTIPIGIIGLLGRHFIAGPLRNLWVVVVALVVWSAVMWFAERVALKQRSEAKMNLTDAIFIGVVQCFSLVPGVSRSGATISAGLLRGLDRVAATRISFFLSIPALIAAGGFEAATSASDISATVGWGATAVGTLVSLIVAYVSIAWLLRLVQRHPITVFIWYRIAVAIVVALLLGFGVISAT